jgi:hypothetical protein
VRELDEGESAEWAEAQKRYIEALAKRRQFISESSRGLSQLKLRAQARIDEVMREIESKRPAVGESAQIKQEVKEALAEMLEGKKPAEEEKK